MISELSVKTKPSNNKAKIAFYTTLCLGAVGAIAYVVLRAMAVNKSGLVGFIPLVALTAAVFFYNKYVSPSYYYDVTFDSTGYALFVVRQIIGKRQSTLCRIGLSEILKIQREDTKVRKAHKTPKDHRRYVYLPTFMPEVTYRIISKNRYERSEILIECSDEFAKTLEDYAREAKELDMRLEEEE